VDPRTGLDTVTERKIYFPALILIPVVRLLVSA
jgi:hypothetical protein